ncbi:unnamed protein product [Cladocopium goreaui]|uniref:Uncharacterized protein n=1 Tax=Cladocopium goreaui TaxID=2562237 RepID=A0A9P1CKW2_9DINO|nr:unnamed protein product [Cladocopium goreaui]
MDERRNYLSVATAALKAQHLALEQRPRVSRGLTPLPGLLGSRVEGPSGKGDNVPRIFSPPHGRSRETEEQPRLASAVMAPVAPPAPAVPMEPTAPRPPAMAAFDMNSDPSEGDEESEEEADRTANSEQRQIWLEDLVGGFGWRIQEIGNGLVI